MRKITNELIANFKERLIEEEKSPATVDKYVRDVTLFMDWCNSAPLCKALVLEYKQMAVEKYAPASANSMYRFDKEQKNCIQKAQRKLCFLCLSVLAVLHAKTRK